MRSDTLVRLEDRDGELVGWTQVHKPFRRWPDILVWNERIFRFASPDHPADYRLYIEASIFTIVTPVTVDPPPETI